MSERKQVKVWGLAIRVFHWSLAGLFFLSYITGEELESLHAWLGYGVIVLLVFRLFWGFVGPKYARFRDFIYSPSAIGAYLKSLTTGEPQRYLGHNPAGGLMVLALLASLAMTTWSGLEAYAAEGQGPLANAKFSLVSSAFADGYESHHDEDDDEEGGENETEQGEESDEFWEEIHEFFANLTLLLVFIHVTGVLVASYLHKENLVKAMVSGKKVAP